MFVFKVLQDTLTAPPGRRCQGVPVWASSCGYRCS